MEKIKITYDFLKELGGLERVMFFQANNLSKYFNVELLFSYISDKERDLILRDLNLDKKVKISQIGHIKNEIFQLLLSFINPWRINEQDAKLIVSHSFMCTQMAFRKKKKDSTPYVVMMHHPPQLLYGRSIKWVNNLPRLFAYILGITFGEFLKKMDKKAVRNAELVVANSNYTASRVKKIYERDPLVIYPAVSDEFYILEKIKAKRIIKKLGLEKKFLLLHGRMIKDKRPDWAIKAYSTYIKSGGEIDLVISGTIEEERSLRELISKLNVQRGVKILGRVSKEELVALYSSASCFLMSAPKEDFGLTPVEAMACGCPVVAWNDGAGPSETVIEYVNGLLAKPYSINDFASKIERVLQKKWDKNKVSKSILKFRENQISNELKTVVKSLTVGQKDNFL